MNATQRFRAQNLTRILAQHTAWEQRTLRDLKAAGFAFTSITQARRHLAAQEQLQRMTTEEVIEQIAMTPTTSRRKTA